MGQADYVFGYGSLLRRFGGVTPADGVVCHLSGFRRAWNVAMDNRRTIAGYKYYVDRETGERPASYVTFLNICAEPGSAVNGVAYRIDAALLPLLDERERNYARREVADLLDTALDGRVWAYVGTDAARRRYETGRTGGRACVSEAYHAAIRDGFARVGPAALDEFDRTTDALEVPLRALRRIDLPGGIAAPAGPAGRG